MRFVLTVTVVLAIAILAATNPTALAQAPPCIPSGEGAAPYGGDWTYIPRAERIALCKEGERREQARKQQRTEAEAAVREPQKPAEITKAAEPAAVGRPPAPAGERVDRGAPILRGTDASGLPILTDDPNILRR